MLSQQSYLGDRSPRFSDYLDDTVAVDVQRPAIYKMTLFGTAAGHILPAKTQHITRVGAAAMSQRSPMSVPSRGAAVDGQV